MIILKYKGGKNSKMWEVEKDIKHILHNKTTLIIPKGFKTYLSSVNDYLYVKK